jgi:putative PIN family toxin of toxin-antitoxin system
MKRIVMDTNILVSALLTPFGAPSGVLDLVLNGDVVLLFDDRIMAEYRDVLHRRRFGFDPALVGHLVEYIEATGEHVVGHPFGARLRDPSEAPFLEVAVTGMADALVTGNKRHYPPGNVPVLKPNEFLKMVLK